MMPTQKLCATLLILVCFPILMRQAARAQAPTAAETQAVKNKLNMAVPYFKQTWSLIFRSRALYFDPPAVFTFTGSVNTGCGLLKAGNAFYCEKDRRVYLDVDLLAGLVRQTAAQTHTDGDYAAIIVAAHEIGHVVHHQLSTKPFASFNEEQTADCFAGAVTNQARIDGHLDPGDLAEGRYSLLMAGDLQPGPGLVGHIITQNQPGAHGTADDRILAFNRGYYAGAAACVGELGLATLPPGGRILFEDNFQPHLGTRPANTPTCSLRPERGGTLVGASALLQGGSCNLAVRNFGNIPNHVRLEATFRLVSGPPQGQIGFYFGSPPLGGLKHYYDAFIQADGGYGLYDNTFIGPIIYSDPHAQLVAKGYGATNRVTVDIHRDQFEATILLYINGKFAGIAKPLFGMGDKSKSHNEQAGLYLQIPGMQAVFTDFRVIALPEDR